MTLLNITLENRPGDSPEVGWATTLDFRVSSAERTKTLGLLEEALVTFIDSQRWGLMGDYDYVRLLSRLRADALDFIDSAHEGYGDRYSWSSEHCDETTHITRLTIRSEYPC